MWADGRQVVLLGDSYGQDSPGHCLGSYDRAREPWSDCDVLDMIRVGRVSVDSCVGQLGSLNASGVVCTRKLDAREQVSEEVLGKHSHFTLHTVVEQQARRNRWAVEAPSPPPLARMGHTIWRVHL
jgi:hypothetical protein